MAGKSFIRVDIFYEEGGTVVSSNKVKVTDDRIILKGTNFGEIPHDAEVKAVGFLADGLVYMEGKITLSTGSQLNFEVTKDIGRQERRSYLKVKAVKNAELLQAYSLGRESKAYRIDEQILTRDLSLGGISFYSNRILLKKQNVDIDISEIIPESTVSARVLRKERGQFTIKEQGAHRSFRFLYACRFLNISGETERALCEFVFRIQLENRKKPLRNGG